MLTIRRNFGLLLFFFKRCIANSSLSGNKHYEFFVRHVKTNLNNRSYIIKQTTAVPKTINYLSPVSYRDVATNISCNPSLTNFEINNETENTFFDNVHPQQIKNKLVNQYSTKEKKTNEYRYGVFSNNYKKESFSSNRRVNNLFPTSSQDVKISDDGDNLSLNEIKGLVNNKIKDILMTSFTKNNKFSDDFVILNQNIPERESLIFFKKKDIHVIESSRTNFKNEVRNYIKKIDSTERNMDAPERLNFITFSKVYSVDKLFGYSSELRAAGSWNCSHETTLKVKNSVPLERNPETSWIPYGEEGNSLRTWHSFYDLSPPPQSGPPFTEQVPIKRDKLIEDNVVPDTSILNIINSIDKSAVIIQKDLYITDRIIQKIQKEEKPKVIDKNKLETIAEVDHVVCLDTSSVKSNTLVSAGINEASSNVLKEGLDNSNKKNVNTNQITSNNNNNNGLPAFTLDSVDGKISLSMLYEPNKIVPMFSFISKEPADEYSKSNDLLEKSDINGTEKLIFKSYNNNYMNPKRITKVSSPDNTKVQLSTPTKKNRLKQLEEKYHHQKRHGEEYEKECSKTLKVVKTLKEPDNKSQEESLKEHTLHKNILVYDSRTISLGEGLPMDVYINRCNTATTSPEGINYHYPTEDKQDKSRPTSEKSLETPTDHSTEKETVPSDINYTCKEKPIGVNKFINSTPNSIQDSNNTQQINNVHTKKLENGFSIMEKVTNKYEPKYSSDVDKSLEKLVKYYALKKEMALSNDVNNESETGFLGTPKDAATHIARNIIPDIVKSVENWFEKYISKKEISALGVLSNESEKKCLEKPDEIAQHIVRVVTGSLENWLKDNIPKRIASGSKYTDPSHLKDKIVPDILNSLEKLFKGYFSKTKESVFNATLPDVEMPIERHVYDVRNNKALLNDDYHPSNMDSSELEDIEKDYLNQEEINDDYEISVKGPTQNSEPLTDDEYFLNTKSNISEDKMQESNKKSQYTSTNEVSCPQFYSLGSSNETSNKILKNKEDPMKNNITINKDGNCNKKRIYFSDSGSKSEAKIPLTESNQPPIMKHADAPRGLSSISGKSGKDPYDGRKTDENSNKNVPMTSEKNKSNSSVDHVKKTTISSVERNNFTDINVSQVETYVDSRLPVPFSTETFLQIFGSNRSLREHSSLIDVAKYRLSTPNAVMEQSSNLSVMEKLDDIRRSVQYLNVIAMNSKLSQSKGEKIQKNKSIVPSKEESESFANYKGMVKSGTKQQWREIETTKNKMKNTEKAINVDNVPNLVSNFTFKIFNNKNIPIKDLKRINKQNTPVIKNQDNKISTKDENSLLILGTKKENVKEAKTNINKPGIQKVELTGIKISRAKYVDLYSFNKNEKNKRHMLQGHKKGLYDHRGLSKRDKKILREITKEKLKGKSSRRRPMKPLTSRKTGEDIQQPIKPMVKKSKDIKSTAVLPKNDNELIAKAVIPNTHLSSKQKLLPPGKNNQEKNEVQKTNTEKAGTTSNRVIQNVDKEKPLKYQRKNLKEINPDKAVEKIKITGTKSTKAERFNTTDKGNLKQVAKSEKNRKNTSIDGDNVDKFEKIPICQTYIATEAYINRPEKIQQIPEKIFTSKKVLKNNPALQKVTIIENINNTIEENNSDALKIQEDFGKELIRKSQNKIEHKTNIDFKVRTPKLKSPKSKVIVFKSKQEGKLAYGKMQKDKKRTEIKNKHTVTKKHLKKKTDHASPMEAGTVKKTTRKSSSQQKNIKNDEFNKVNKLLQRNKKTTEVINNKIPERMSKEAEKPQQHEQIKMAATDKLKPSKEAKIDKNSVSDEKKNVLMFLVDVDKMSKEIKPELDLQNSQKCQVAHEKITDFPLHNQGKKLLFKPPFQILNLGPTKDPALRDELKLFPSVTKVLNSTIQENSREILREWRRGMIAQLGEDGFKLFYKGQLINGNKFNWELHNFLLSREKHKPDLSNLGLKSIENVLRRTSDLSAINSHVIHRKLAYRGVIDCVAKYQNRPVLIEWKRLDNPQVKIENSSIDFAATQLSAYVGALNYDETYKFQISGGLIVLAYNDGSEAEVIEINTEQCNKHWKKWLRRLQTYHESSRNNKTV